MGCCDDVTGSDENTAADVVVIRAQDDDHPREFTESRLSRVQVISGCSN